jgi:hypothetical protein
MLHCTVPRYGLLKHRLRQASVASPAGKDAMSWSQVMLRRTQCAATTVCSDGQNEIHEEWSGWNAMVSPRSHGDCSGEIATAPTHNPREDASSGAVFKEGEGKRIIRKLFWQQDLNLCLRGAHAYCSPTEPSATTLSKSSKS